MRHIDLAFDADRSAPTDSVAGHRRKAAKLHTAGSRRTAFRHGACRIFDVYQLWEPPAELAELLLDRAGSVEYFRGGARLSPL